MMTMTKLTTKTMAEDGPLVIFVGESRASNNNRRPADAELVVCRSGRALRRRLKQTGTFTVVAEALEDLGDGESSAELARTLREIGEVGATLVVAGKTHTSSELAAMLAVVEANSRINRSKVRLGKSRSKAKDGRPRVEFDLVLAQRLRDEGMSLRMVAEACGTSESTAWRRLSGAASPS